MAKIINKDNIIEILESKKEESQKDYFEKLIPGIKNVLGVKVPILRKIAKDISKGDYLDFLEYASEDIYEIIMIKGFIIGEIKNFKVALPLIKDHIEKITDWSLCDSFCSSLKIIEQNRHEFLKFLTPYSKINDEFKQRFVAVILLNYYLNSLYIDKTLKILGTLKNDSYYCKMAVAWAVSEAFVEQKDKTLKFLESNKLETWTYNKAIQKLLESCRVSRIEKDDLRKMKR
jgi:3-methyladenine DNA glycosylase AlkD